MSGECSGAGRGTVYVIDDDDAVRDSLLFLLAVSELPAQGFPSAAAFLAAHDAQRRGCIITDLRMPGIDGADLLRLLPERGIDLPVILITGHGDVAAAARVMEAGAFDFIEKPFQAVAILDAVHAALAISQPDPARAARARATGDRIAHLAERERSLLDGLVLGESSGTLSCRQGIALSDIELMRVRIMRRVGAASLPELVRLVTEARRYGAQAGANL